jgi:hypothetical protein
LSAGLRWWNDGRSGCWCLGRWLTPGTRSIHRRRKGWPIGNLTEQLRTDFPVVTIGCDDQGDLSARRHSCKADADKGRMRREIQSPRKGTGPAGHKLQCFGITPRN